MITMNRNNLPNALDLMESAIKKASIMRLLRSTHLISELRQRKNIFRHVDPHFNYFQPGEDIRKEVCLVNEDSIAWEEIQLKPGSFEDLVNSLTAPDSKPFSDPEIKKYFLSGPLMTYCRSLALVTDFLENDSLIPASYPEQNLNRALNQFTLLEQMEAYLLKKYQFDLYAVCK